MTLSRSTLTKTCGTFGRNVGIRVPSSGRLRARQKRLQVLRQKRDVFAGAIFQNELESAGSAHARNRRRRKREGDTFGKTGELFVNVRLDGVVLFFRLVRSLQGLNVTKKNAL
jgi:hypothetical protein